MEEEDERSTSNFQRSTLKSWLPFLVGQGPYTREF
jgi:hypothetical protein